MLTIFGIFEVLTCANLVIIQNLLIALFNIFFDILLVYKFLEKFCFINVILVLNFFKQHFKKFHVWLKLILIFKSFNRFRWSIFWNSFQNRLINSTFLIIILIIFWLYHWTCSFILSWLFIQTCILINKTIILRFMWFIIIVKAS
jgi:hypothetical protein